MQTFSVTPQGITFKGDTMLPRCEQYVKKAQLLYQQVTPKDWEDRTPHLANQIPVLAKINMLLALANPLSLEKAGFNPDQARDEDGRWTDEGGDLSEEDDDDDATNSDTDSVSKPLRLPQGMQIANSGQITGEADLKDTGRTIAFDPATITLNDGSKIANPYTGGFLIMPSDVSLKTNAALGEWMATLPSLPTLDNVTREEMMISYFERGGAMDYQRQNGAEGLITRGYIDFGNYNYGVVAAAAGYSYDQALAAAAAENITGRGDKSGRWFSNPRNDYFIQAGYNDYKSGKIN